MHSRQQRTELAFGKLNWCCLSWRKKSRLQSPVSPLPLIHTFTCTCISTLDLPSVTLAFTGMYGHGTKVSFGLGFKIFFHFLKTPMYYPFSTSQLPIILVPIFLPEHLLLTICYGFILFNVFHSSFCPLNHRIYLFPYFYLIFFKNLAALTKG